MKMVCKRNGTTIGQNIRIYSSFFDRLVGLMFLRKMNGFDGVLIKSCNSIHTCFMNFNIDVIFLDKNYKIIRIIRNLVPWRMTRMHFKATQVVELNGGALSEEIRIDDVLEELCIN